MLKVVSFEDKMFAVADAIEFDQIPNTKFSMRSYSTCIFHYVYALWGMGTWDFRCLAENRDQYDNWHNLVYPLILGQTPLETEIMQDRKLAAEQVRKFARQEPIDPDWCRCRVKSKDLLG